MPSYTFYIETSAWNFLVTEDAAEKRSLTLQFFRKANAGAYRICISRLVALEMARTRNPIRRAQLLELLRRHAPALLPILPEARLLAEKYILQGTIPNKYVDDALHVAIAVVHRIDAVVSWNMRHLVKLKTRREVNALNRLNGYQEIEIVTPEEAL